MKKQFYLIFVMLFLLCGCAYTQPELLSQEEKSTPKVSCTPSVPEDASGEYADQDDDPVVYGNFGEGLSRIEVETGKYVPLCEDIAENIKAAGDELFYYVSRENPEDEYDLIPEIYRIRTDGTQRELLVTGAEFQTSFEVLEDWLYYFDAHHELCRIHIRKKTIQRLGSVYADFWKGTDCIYAGLNEVAADGQKVYRLDADGTAGILVFTHQGNPIYQLQQIGEWLYYTDSDPLAAIPAPGEKRYFYRVAAVGGTPTALTEVFCYGFHVYRNDFYVFDAEENMLGKLYRIHGQTGEKEFVCKLPLQRVYTSYYNGCLFYGIPNGQDEITVVRIPLS